MATGLISAGLGAMLAPQAAAAGRIGFLAPTSSAYVDSATPSVSHADPSSGVPIGAHATGHPPIHTTKAYFTFDLSQFAGTDVRSAVLDTPETAVTDCSVTTAPQAWLTDTSTDPTWVHQPTERTQLGAVGETGCPAVTNLTWNGSQALSAALAAGRTTVTIEVRLPADEQFDLRHGIVIGSNPELVVQFNHAPLVPTALTVEGTACSAQPVLVGKILSTVGMTLAANISDPDADHVTGEFDWWPVDDPDQRHVVNQPNLPSGSTAKATILPSELSDATTYAWQVRGDDGIDTGPFSPICEFTTEFTTPPEAPVVTSTDYPPSQTGPGTGGTGEPGTFTFSGSGDPDITGFEYGVPGLIQTFVAADQPGGSATIQFTPTNIGPNTLAVQTVDRAGDFGETADYRFWVANNEPHVSCTPASAFVGVPRQCTFTPASTDVVGYQYQFAGGSATDVVADADGSATVTITPTDANVASSLEVRARLANGNLTAESFNTLQTDPAQPTIDQDPPEALAGTPVRYTFHALLPNSVSFTYTFGGDSPATVPADPDGTVTVTLTSDSSFVELDVFSTSADGVDSGTTIGFPFLDTDEPVVTSTDYPEDSEGGGVGVPGTFTFTSPVPGVTSYTYDFNGEEGTVPAGPDGSAQVVLTPTGTSVQELLVSSTLPDGGVSDETSYAFSALPPASAALGSAHLVS